MGQDLSNKYFVKKSYRDEWTDVTSRFDGVKILTVGGLDELGDATNVFTQQWSESQVEDYVCVTKDGNGNDVIIRQNVDISVTFVISRRYSSTKNIDEQTVHRSFIDFFCNRGDFYIMSMYVNKRAHVVCLKSYKPTSEKLNRGMNSYILGTITLHTLDMPEST